MIEIRRVSVILIPNTQQISGVYFVQFGFPPVFSAWVLRASTYQTNSLHILLLLFSTLSLSSTSPSSVMVAFWMVGIITVLGRVTRPSSARKGRARAEALAPPKFPME